MTNRDQLKWRANGLALGIPLWVFLAIRTDSWLYFVVAIFAAMASARSYAELRKLTGGERNASAAAP